MGLMIKYIHAYANTHRKKQSDSELARFAEIEAKRKQAGGKKKTKKNVDDGGLAGKREDR